MISARPALFWLCLPALTLACDSAQDRSQLDSESSDSTQRDLDSPNLTESGNTPVDADSRSPMDPSQEDMSEYNCTIAVGLTTIDHNRTDAQSLDSDFCDDARDELSRFIASGADTLVEVDGGLPQGANANCSADNSGKAVSTMSVTLEVVKKHGHCPPMDQIDLEVPVELFGIIETEAYVSSHINTPSTVDQWEDISFENMAGGRASVGGTDMETAVSNLNLTVGTDCVDTDLSDVTSRDGDVMIRTASQSICGKEATDTEAVVPNKARSEGQTFLTLGTNGRSMTKLLATTAYRATATSTNCPAGGKGPDCIELISTAQVETLNYCLEVSTEDVCNIASDIPGVNCIIDTRNAVMRMGNCD